MKKLLPVLLLSAVITICSTSAIAEEVGDKLPTNNVQQEKQINIRQSFEKRLNLTDKQKEKAKKIHEKGAKQIKPIMQKIRDLKKEIAQIKKSDLDEAAKKEQLNKKFKEIRALNKKANEIRKSNGQEFEKILTKEQKQELEKMKAEGRKRFEKHHPSRPPFNMFPPEHKRGEKGIFPPPPAQRFEK